MRNPGGTIVPGTFAGIAVIGCSGFPLPASAGSGSAGSGRHSPSSPRKRGESGNPGTFMIEAGSRFPLSRARASRSLPPRKRGTDAGTGGGGYAFVSEQASPPHAQGDGHPVAGPMRVTLAPPAFHVQPQRLARQVQTPPEPVPALPLRRPARTACRASPPRPLRPSELQLRRRRQPRSIVERVYSFAPSAETRSRCVRTDSPSIRSPFSSTS